MPFPMKKLTVTARQARLRREGIGVGGFEAGTGWNAPPQFGPQPDGATSGL
jgi:hypothetical protein